MKFATTDTTATFDLFVHTDPVAPDRVFIGASGAHPKAVPFTLADGPELFGRPQIPTALDHAILIWREPGDLWSIEMRRSHGRP